MFISYGDTQSDINSQLNILIGIVEWNNYVL